MKAISFDLICTVISSQNIAARNSINPQWKHSSTMLVRVRSGITESEASRLSSSDMHMQVPKDKIRVASADYWRDIAGVSLVGIDETGLPVDKHHRLLYITSPVVDIHELPCVENNLLDVAC